jgi:hypothetical protein
MYRSIMNASNKVKVFTLLLAMVLVNAGCDSADQSNANQAATPVPVVDNSKANIKFTENTVQAGTGSDLILKVAMQDLPATEGGGITLNYDSSMISVSVINVNQGNWSFSNKNGVIDNAAGMVSDILFSNYNGVQGNAEISTITIHTIRPGKSVITLSGSQVNPFASNGKQLNVSFGKLEVITTAN